MIESCAIKNSSNVPNVNLIANKFAELDTEGDDKSEYTQLNDDWIKTFENTDNLYKDFYKENIFYINLKILYVNRDNTVDKIKKEPFYFSSPNLMCKEQIIKILKSRAFEDDKRYSLLSIIKYNITLDPDDIKTYIASNYDDARHFLKVINNIDDIIFEPSINMFQDLNDLIFVYYEKSKELVKRENKNCTKKIILNGGNTASRKTLRKQYKD
jgi:hypothetical protein